MTGAPIVAGWDEPTAREVPTLLVDIGGTKLCVAVASGDEIVRRRRIEGIADIASGTQLADLIARTATQLGWVNSTHAVIVVAVPGAIDLGSTRVIHAANLPLRGFRMVEELWKRLGRCRVVLEDDANCGALGERARGAARGYSDIAYVSLSTGIGMGAISGGRLVRGRHRQAGEVGHMVIVPGGRACGCGRSGCLEAYVSGRAFARAVAATPGRTPSTVPNGALTSGRDVVEAAYAGDLECRSIVNEGLTRLMIGVDAVCAVLDPAIVVFGGGLMKNPGFARDVLGAARNSRRPECEISFVASELDDESVLAGALELARRVDLAGAS